MLLFLKLNETHLNIYDIILYYIRIWFTCEYGYMWFICEYYVYLSKEEPLGFSLAIQQLFTVRKVRAVGTRSSLLLWDWLCLFLTIIHTIRSLKSHLQVFINFILRTVWCHFQVLWSQFLGLNTVKNKLNDSWKEGWVASELLSALILLFKYICKNKESLSKFGLKILLGAWEMLSSDDKVPFLRSMRVWFPAPKWDSSKLSVISALWGSNASDYCGHWHS